MRIQPQGLQLSASDLANHLGCNHLTMLNLAAAKGELSTPIWNDPMLEVLQRRGIKHESEYIEFLQGQGLSVVNASRENQVLAFEATQEAMLAGVDVITQATLISGNWFGIADVLRRIQTDTDTWHYEVVETKLAKETKAGTILQLCLYSTILGELQKNVPEFMHVVRPNTGFESETFRVDDYLAYYRLVKRRLETATMTANSTYPEPVAKCEECKWWSACESRRRDDDHLSFVAGITKLQRRQLEDWGARTLQALAELPLPLAQRPKRGSIESYVRVREQARLQLDARRSGDPVFEFLPRELDRGLARLPEPSDGDIFFDIEGDPFFGNSGLEYLLGWVTQGEEGPKFDGLWSINTQEERVAFEAFIDMVMARWEKYPDLHIYHFAPYETVAMKRLMGRFATREDEVDRLLRAGIFVDLYSISKQAIRAGIERYSIKDLEQFYGYARDVELPEATRNLRAFEFALELGQVEEVPADVMEAVEGYNRDDCVSTLYLRDWLESLRLELLEKGEEIPRPEWVDGSPTENLDERQKRVRALMDQLLVGVPEDREGRTNEEHAKWLLAHMLDWHRREEKAPWWEFFRLCELTNEDFLDENEALAGLKFIGVEKGKARSKSPVHRYSFPVQDSLLEAEDGLYIPGGDSFGKVVAVDSIKRLVDIKKPADLVDLHPDAVFAHTVVTAPEQAKALFRLGEWVVANGIDASGSYRPARDLLLNYGPRLGGIVQGSQPLEHVGETTTHAASRISLDLDGVLAIQGPPGSGKTYTGARMICDLVLAGKTVGITALSHKVIRNLLDAVVVAADEQDLLIRCLQKVSGKAATFRGGAIRETIKNKTVTSSLKRNSMSVVGGTPWLWSRKDLTEAVDVLFVDEAGQMSLANVIAIAQCAKSVVLLGDPQQLDQPLQGAHPEGTEVSALEHLLAGHQTIPSHRGLFLSETWRLHPSICSFTSELFYEGRLGPRPDLINQKVVGDTPFSGAGIWVVPVEHDGNRNTSEEEVEVVVDLYQNLLSDGLNWVNREKQASPITVEDVLIVAPYNAHVGALGERLTDARIGTVDKFQGQEAAVVIYSMATSSPDEATRGIEFLLSLNRLNVATSRARCVCILVASPRLFEVECRTPAQIKLANAFCRYLELATVLSTS